MRSRSFYLKDPDAVLDYTVDWGAWLPEGDQLDGRTDDRTMTIQAADR